MDIGQKDIELIVQQVLKNVVSQSAAAQSNSQPEVKTYRPGVPVQEFSMKSQYAPSSPYPSSSQSSAGDYGVFETMDQAVEAAYQAQKIYQAKFQLKDRERLIKSIRETGMKNVEKLARMSVDETGLGRYEDKILKNTLVLERTPGTECLKTEAISGDDGLTIIEHAPYGVIGSITPVTNPTETIINNVISMIAGGNSVVFNVHPSAKESCRFAVQMINKAIEEVGGPKNLVSMVKQPTLDTVSQLSKNDKVRLMAGTGGMPMVRSLLQSGKKVIGAGAGNPPVIVDETADIKRAAAEIFKGASFDNNVLCLAEKEVFIVESVATDFVYNMIQEGAFLLNESQLEKIMNLVLTYEETPNGREYHTSKNWVGKDAGKMLDAIGINGKSDCRLLICEVGPNHPFVLLEQLMPVLPIVKCKNLDEAIKFAMIAEHGNRHTASMFSQSINNLTRFAREVETTIFVKNAATLAGVGFGGEGHTTMTIAGPTGEGITNAVSFTRQRRCALSEGGFRII
ncbi:aldehyde dehydrogenase family protein [Proteocatella sphenisci]|uniref:aldehyde dehydrogenase family protein n=1 Tax=Proteocatella sphenisci TaxID=181070 RepID=UPI00048C7E73|nr:aldehyde dehydrogenase family protein [Proteocatella sphenisci]